MHDTENADRIAIQHILFHHFPSISAFTEICQFKIVNFLPIFGKGVGRKIFRGGPIRIDPELTSKNERIFEI